MRLPGVTPNFHIAPKGVERKWVGWPSTQEPAARAGSVPMVGTWQRANQAIVRAEAISLR